MNLPTYRPTDRPTDHRQDNHNETGISDYSSFILHLAPPFFAALIAAPARDTVLWIEDRRERRKMMLDLVEIRPTMNP